jgi:protein-S-isoprenylcysteine O-methyltransferase Ste14
MFARALLAFALPPGVVAYGLPLPGPRSEGRSSVVHPLGRLALAIGTLALLARVRDVFVAGRGTLAPGSPPRELVVVGLYRYSRNPMHVAVLLILLGWAGAFASAALSVHAIAVALAFHVRVVWGEQPRLARTHGEQWQRYRRRVRRWC